MPRVLCALLLLSGFASASAQQAAPSADGPARVIRGVVMAQNDARLPRVRILARAPSTNRLVSAVMSDGSGRFVLPIGETTELRITLAKAGYAAQTIALSIPDPGATPPRELEVRLARGAAIAGRIVDRRGEPAALTRVVARRVSDDANREAGGGVEYESDADDLGDYRIGGLPEGRYIVAPRPASATSRPGSPAPPAAADAATVTVRAGDELASIDFTVEPPPLPSPQAPPSAAGDTAVISGRVTSRGGQALEGVLVRAMRPGTAIRSAVSTADGRYAVSGLPAGAYRIEAIKNGYVTLQYGQETANAAGRMVEVGAGQAVDRIDVALPRGSAIAGTVVDEYGDPLNDVAVDVLQMRNVAGRVRALRLRGRRTDDRGRYRVFGLLPGTYVVRVQIGESLSNSATEGYPPVYVPGSPRVEQASQIRIDLGRDVLDGDVVVRPSTAVSVRGVALDSSGKPIRGGVLMVVSERSGAVQIEPTQTFPREDGSFVFTNVPPGDYVVQAASPPEPGPDGRPASLPEFAAQYVTVTEVSPLPLQLRTSRGTTLTGRITVEGRTGVPTSGLALIATPSDFDRAPMIGSGSMGFSVDGDGAFRYAGLTGPRRLQLSAAPSGWYLKSAVIKGEDVSDKPFDFGLDGIALADAEIVVSPAGAALSGIATDDRGRPVVEYTVVVFPTDPGRWFRGSRWVKIARPSQDAAYRVDGLPPGEYWTAAVDRVEGTPGGGEWQDAEFLQALAERAARVTLGDGQSHVLTLRVINR